MADRLKAGVAKALLEAAEHGVGHSAHRELSEQIDRYRFAVEPNGLEATLTVWPTGEGVRAFRIKVTEVM